MAKVRRPTDARNGASPRPQVVEWFKSLSPDERREVVADMDSEELRRWRKDSKSPRPSSRPTTTKPRDSISGDKVESIAAEVTGRLSRRRARLGAPNAAAFGDTIQKARDADADRRWEAETRNPLRVKAARAARALLEALRHLADAETGRPSLLLARAMLPEKTGPEQPAPSRVLYKLSDPDFVAKLLPYLIAGLDVDRSRAARGRGRPPATVERVADEAARTAGIGDGKIADLLASEGLEGGADDARARGTDDARARVRQRRRRRGGRKPTPRT